MYICLNGICYISMYFCTMPRFQWIYDPWLYDTWYMIRDTWYMITLIQVRQSYSIATNQWESFNKIGVPHYQHIQIISLRAVSGRDQTVQCSIALYSDYIHLLYTSQRCHNATLTLSQRRIVHIEMTLLDNRHTTNWPPLYNHYTLSRGH